jgi:YbbR domain-containing protein
MPADVHVTVRGPRRTVEELIEAGVPPITLDLRDGATERINFEPDQFAFPPDLEVKIIDPANIELRWEDVIERRIPVQSSLTGSVARGFETGTVTVDPDHIMVRGPRSVLEAMQHVSLAAFDVTGLSAGTYSRPIAMDPPPSRVRYLSIPNATVSVEVRRRVIPLKFPERKVEVLGPPGAVTKPRVVEVTVTGPPEVVNGLRADQVIPRVDFKAANIDTNEQQHGTAALPVSVDVANAHAEVQPPTVLVRW